MNTLNEFELNRIKRLHAQELEASRNLQRSKSSRLTQRLAQNMPNTCHWQTSGGLAAQLRRQQPEAAAAFDSDSPAASASTSPPPPPPPLPAFLLKGSSVDSLLEAELEQLAGQTVPVDLKRYQHALSLKQRRARASRPRQPRFCRAQYDFLAKNEGELSLKRGDLLELLELLEGARWARVEDCQSGLQGLVPLAYLDHNIGCALAKRDVAARSQSGSRSGSRFSNSASPELGGAEPELQPEQLLPMCKGEPIALIRRLSGHLYEASNTRQATGLVWSNDLEIIRQPPGAAANFHQQQQQQQRRPFATAAANDDDEFELDQEETEREEEEEEAEDDELAQYLDQLRSICTDLNESSRRRCQLRPLASEQPADPTGRSLARRRRARSASGALNEQQQQQQQQQYWRDQEARASSTKRLAGAGLSQPAGELGACWASCSCAGVGQPGSANLQRHLEQRHLEQQHLEHHHHHQHRHQQQHELHYERRPARSTSSPQIVAAMEREPPVPAAGPLPRLCRARYAYKPRQSDELELVPGDILVVVQQCDDGWFIGSSYTTKQMGTFPGNFVEPV